MLNNFFKQPNKGAIWFHNAKIVKKTKSIYKKTYILLKTYINSKSREQKYQKNTQCQMICPLELISKAGAGHLIKSITKNNWLRKSLWVCIFE